MFMPYWAEEVMACFLKAGESMRCNYPTLLRSTPKRALDSDVLPTALDQSGNPACLGTPALRKVAGTSPSTGNRRLVNITPLATK